MARMDNPNSRDLSVQAEANRQANFPPTPAAYPTNDPGYAPQPPQVQVPQNFLTRATNRLTTTVKLAADTLNYFITGVRGDNWFGPLQPLPPQAQQAKGRRFDYPYGSNIRYTPRADEQISFDQLKRLSESWDLVRLCIETRKDQIEKMEWDVKYKGDINSDPDDPKLQKIKARFAYPDRRNAWGRWLRQLIEQHLVIDAATINPVMTAGGDLYALELIDGATLKVLVDEQGRRPSGDDVAYVQTLHGLPAVFYSDNDLIYAVRNPRADKIYGFSPVEQILITVNLGIRRQLFQLQWYTEGNVPEAIGVMEDGTTVDQVRDFQTWFDSVLAGNTAARRRVNFVAGIKDLKFPKTIDEKNPMDEWLARVVCYAFSLPPTPFIQQMNRATAQTAQQAALQEGLVPLMNWVKEIMNLVLTKYMKIDDVEFTWKSDPTEDRVKLATARKLYVESGILSIDEVREDMGFDRIGVDNAIITPQGLIPIKKGQAEIDPPGAKPKLTAPPPQANTGDADKAQAEKIEKLLGARKKG